jgi:hypothetical protein
LEQHETQSIYVIQAHAPSIQALLGKGTREHMVKWLAAVIEGNRERAKMRWDVKKGASHGFFWNFNQVCMRACVYIIQVPSCYAVLYGRI